MYIAHLYSLRYAYCMPERHAAGRGGGHPRGRGPRPEPAARAGQRPEGGRRGPAAGPGRGGRGRRPRRGGRAGRSGQSRLSTTHNGRPGAGHRPAPSPFRQPKAVWAVAFACVVSFMGIGLVDPILPALSKQLKASPSSVELLFTSYLVVTAVAMLVTGWVSSRIGGKRTLVAGLVLIVAGSALAAASHPIGEIIGFRAGWGVRNGLFIATSLAVGVGAPSA